MPVIIGDTSLSIDDVVRVARDYDRVIFGPVAQRRVALGRQVVEVLVKKEIKVYGVTTGFASMRDRFVSRDEAQALSRNLIRSHSAGVGEPFAEDIVRTATLLRAHALAQGCSGVTVDMVHNLVAALNARIYPFVPRQGSVGSSGDLAPLSHLFLALIGDPWGRVHVRLTTNAIDAGNYVSNPRKEDFVRLDFKTIPYFRSALQKELADGVEPVHQLREKEGLAATNGAVFSTALLVLAVHDARRLTATSEVAAGLSCEALQAVPDFLDAEIAALRPHPGHIESSARLRRILAGSELVPEAGPCGLNMAQYNRTVSALSVVCREEPDTDELVPLLERMQSLQGRLWREIENEREAIRSRGRNPKDVTAYWKAEELRACGTVIQPILDEWLALLGWADGNPRNVLAVVRRKLSEIYHDHVSKIALPSKKPRVQDNYSFRASTTVLGAARDAITYAERIAVTEMNSCTDNPLILLKALLDKMDRREDIPAFSAFSSWLDANWPEAADRVRSAANFHGEPIGLVADHLAATVAEIGNIAERRVAVLTDSAHSNGLPGYLTWDAGLHSGLMIAQYTAASLVTENRVLSHPASTDSIPTAEGTEDHVAMSTFAARKLGDVIANTEYIVAIELLAGYQGVQFRKPARLGAGTQAAERKISNDVGPLFLECAESNMNGMTWGTVEQMQAVLSRLGLSPAAIREIQPCILGDIPVSTVIESIVTLVRRGSFADINSALG